MQKEKVLDSWIEKQELKFKIIKKMPFTSDRKRMSILVEDSEGNYKLYIKGADNVILERISRKRNKEPYIEQTEDYLLKAAQQGYRTLLIAVRLLERHEVDDFLMCLAKAESDFSADRAQRLRNVYDQLESELFLLGATVVEDRLQDNVPETIEALHDADIKLWVLTGDKLETAESIGFSSSLLNPSMTIFRCTKASDIKNIPYTDGKL